MISEALTSFGGYPPFLGTLVVHSVEGDLTYRMWAREPEFRVEVDLDGQPLGPWVSDGETTNILEPHVHAFAFTATDPRGPDLFFCDHLILAGTGQVAGRPATAVSCRAESQTVTYWIDDETGMIVGGKERSDEGLNWWEFTQFELDPSFPPGLFEVPGSCSPPAEPVPDLHIQASRTGPRSTETALVPLVGTGGQAQDTKALLRASG